MWPLASGFAEKPEPSKALCSLKWTPGAEPDTGFLSLDAPGGEGDSLCPKRTWVSDFGNSGKQFLR